MKKHILLFEEFSPKDNTNEDKQFEADLMGDFVDDVKGGIKKLKSGIKRELSELKGEFYANEEEMKEIEKVKKYYKWWYSNPLVISKINLKREEDKKYASNEILQFIDKKLIPSEFRIFRTKESESHFYNMYGHDLKAEPQSIAWVTTPSEPIFVRLYATNNPNSSLFNSILHEVAHLIQEFAGEKFIDLHNPISPKGSYGTDSIKSGLFLPPLDPKQFDKPYANREIEQFARFHVMRYYFGIKPGDNCSQMCEKIKTTINSNPSSRMKVMEFNGKPFLFLKEFRGSLEVNIYWFFEHYKQKTMNNFDFFQKEAKRDGRKLEKGWAKFYSHYMELDIVCADHQNIVANFDVEERNFA